MYETVPLSTTMTPAMLLGRALEIVLAAGGVVGSAFVVVRVVAKRRASPGRGAPAGTANAPEE